MSLTREQLTTLQMLDQQLFISIQSANNAWNAYESTDKVRKYITYADYINTLSRIRTKMKLIGDVINNKFKDKISTHYVSRFLRVYVPFFEKLNSCINEKTQCRDVGLTTPNNNKF